jgi:hypothetical protein
VNFVRPEVLGKNPLWIANSQRNIVVHFHQDFTASLRSDFFQGRTDQGIFYWPNHTQETWLSKEE